MGYFSFLGELCLEGNQHESIFIFKNFEYIYFVFFDLGSLM